MNTPSYSGPPYASGTIAGLVSTAAQTFAGIKSFSSIIQLPSIATGSLPAAASYPGGIVYDSTASAFKYSNGSAWVLPGSITIGDTVTSGTAGSILFVGTGPVLAQDNTNLFWDDSNNRLGILTSSPAHPLDIRVGTGTRVQATGGTLMATIACIGNYGTPPYGGAIGFAANADTQSIVYQNDGNNYALTFVAQSQANVLAGTPIGASSGYNSGNVVASLYPDGRWAYTPVNQGSTAGTMSYGADYSFQVSRNGTMAETNSILRLKPTFNQGGSNSNQTINILDIDSVNTAVTGTTINLASLRYGGSERFGVVSNGEVRFNNSAGTSGYLLQSNGAGSPPTWVAASGVGAMSIGGTITSATQGSVLFAGAAGVMAQDNAKLFWDDTNDFLGLGTATPASPLDVLPTAVTTQANDYVSGVNVNGSFTKNDTNTRQFYVNQIKPTFNFGGSNANTTVDVLSIDTTNTATTGLTANLINAKYGGTSQFKVSSAGVVTTVGEVTVGNSLVQSGGNQAMEMKGWAADSGSAIGVKIIAAQALSSAGSVIANFYNAATIKASVHYDGSFSFLSALMPNNDAGSVGEVLTSAGPGAPPTWETAAGGITIGDTVTSGTAGSILFVGTGPVLEQDNSKLFWDNSNNRLGVGNAAPTVEVDVTGDVKASGNVTATTYLIIGTQKIGSGSAAPVAGTWAQGDMIFNNAGVAGGSAGWYCVTAGTPGTWKEMALISS